MTQMYEFAHNAVPQLPQAATACVQNVDCEKNDNGKTKCHVFDESGLCVECAAIGDCNNNGDNICDIGQPDIGAMGNHICEKCNLDTDCATEYSGDVSKIVCDDGDGAQAQDDGECVGCTADDDCDANFGDASTCDANRQCTACTLDADCETSDPLKATCDVVTGSPVAPALGDGMCAQCTASANCADLITATLIDDTLTTCAARTCVQCGADEDVSAECAALIVAGLDATFTKCASNECVAP